MLVFFSEFGVCLSIEKSLRAAYRSFHWILEHTLCVVSSVRWKPPTFQQQAARYARSSKSRSLHLKCVRKMLNVLLLHANLFGIAFEWKVEIGRQSKNEERLKLRFGIRSAAVATHWVFNENTSHGKSDECSFDQTELTLRSILRSDFKHVDKTTSVSSRPNTKNAHWQLYSQSPKKMIE